MKRISVLLLVCVMFTGCAQVQDRIQRRLTNPVDLAHQDCQKMGFISGTQQYQNCVYHTTMNIRNTRAQEDAASAAARQSAMPLTTECSQVGSYLSCRTSRF